MADATPVRFDSLDAIPEPLRPHFAEVEEGGTKLYEYRPPREDTSGLKSAKAKIEREAARLQAELESVRKRLTVDGKELDDDELSALIEARNKQREGETLSRADAEREKAELREKITAATKKDLEARESRIGELESTLNSVLIDGGISRTAQDAETPFRLRKGGAEALIKIARADKVFRVIDGKPVPFEGDRPMEKADGSPATMVDWMAKAAAAYGLIEESQGTGAQPPLNGSTPKKAKSAMSMDEKIDFIKKYGEDKYAALPH